MAYFTEAVPLSQDRQIFSTFSDRYMAGHNEVKGIIQLAFGKDLRIIFIVSPDPGADDLPDLGIGKLAEELKLFQSNESFLSRDSLLGAVEMPEGQAQIQGKIPPCHSAAHDPSPILYSLSFLKRGEYRVCIH